MFDQWGAVDGDVNADIIIRDRRQGRRDTTIKALSNFVLMAACATWYASTGNPTAIALEIITAAWLVVSGVKREVYEAHTMAMIGERRAQLIEQKLLALQLTLAELSGPTVASRSQR